MKLVSKINMNMVESFDIASEVIEHSPRLDYMSPMGWGEYETSQAPLLHDNNVLVYEIEQGRQLKDILLDLPMYYEIRSVLSGMTETDIINNTIPQNMLEYMEGVSSPKLTKFFVSQAGEQSELMKTYTTLVKDYRQGYVRKDKGFLVLSDLPHIKTGISFYGEGWSSCQDTDGTHNDEHYIDHLAGFLKEHAFVAFTDFSNRSIEEVIQRPQMRARSIIRHITLNNNETIYMTSKTYARTEVARKLLIDSLQGLGFEVPSNWDLWNNDIEHLSKINIPATVGSICNCCDDDGEVNAEIEGHYDISIDCPACDGSGEIEVYYNGHDHEVDCPACNGSGIYEDELYINAQQYEPCNYCDGEKDGHEQNISSYDDDDSYFRYRNNYERITFKVPTNVLDKYLNGINKKIDINSVELVTM